MIAMLLKRTYRCPFVNTYLTFLFVCFANLLSDAENDRHVYDVDLQCVVGCLGVLRYK